MSSNQTNTTTTNETSNIATIPSTPKAQTANEVIAANVKLLIEQLEAGHSEGLTAYLTAMGRFHNYSFGNILEIARQKPDATRVAGLYAWNQLGRKVMKGQRGMGRACAFVFPDGKPIPWLQTIDTIAVNGRHAVILAENLVRIEMMRVARTCELTITSHSLSIPSGRTRPEVSSKLLFRGTDGYLPADLWQEEHKALRGELTPVFYSRAGELIDLPEQFETAVRKMTAAICCVGCRHTHVAVAPVRPGVMP